MKISALPAVAAPDGTETVVVLKGGTAQRVEVGPLARAAVAPSVAATEAAAAAAARQAEILTNNGGLAPCFAFGLGFIATDADGFGREVAPLPPVVTEVGESPISCFTFGAAFVATDADGFGGDVAAAPPQIVSAGSDADAPVPCFTFGAAFVAVDADGFGSDLASPTGSPAAPTMAVAARRLVPNCGTEGLRLITVATYADDNTSPKTYQSMIETAQHFDAIRAVLINGGSDPLTVGKCVASVRSDTNPGDNNNAADWVPVTFNGGASGVIPPSPGGARVGYLVSDWIPISSLPRTDGGKGGVAMLRAFVSTAEQIKIGFPYSNGAASRTNGYAFLGREAVGDFTTNIGGFAASGASMYTPIVGLSYAARGVVLTVGTKDDSISFGADDDIVSDGFVVRTARAFSDVAGIAFDAVNLAISGTTTDTWLRRYQDFVAAGLRTDLMFQAGGSPNDVGPGTKQLTQTIVNSMKQNRALALALMRKQGTIPILWTWGPYGADTSKPLYFDWGASDQLRVADNAELIAERARGLIVCDFASVLLGSTNAGGQQQPDRDLLGDEVHPKAIGYDRMTVEAETQVKAALAAA